MAEYKRRAEKNNRVIQLNYSGRNKLRYDISWLDTRKLKREFLEDDFVGCYNFHETRSASKRNAAIMDGLWVSRVAFALRSGCKTSLSRYDRFPAIVDVPSEIGIAFFVSSPWWFRNYYKSMETRGREKKRDGYRCLLWALMTSNDNAKPDPDLWINIFFTYFFMHKYIDIVRHKKNITAINSFL